MGRPSFEFDNLSRTAPTILVGVELNTGDPGVPLWIPVSSTELIDSLDLSRGPGFTAWESDIRLPLARGVKPLRLTIKEYENLPTDPASRDITTVTLTRRLVYADVVVL